MQVEKVENKGKQQSMFNPQHQQPKISTNQPTKPTKPFLELILNIDEKYENQLLLSKRFYKKQKWANDIIQTYINTADQSVTIQLHYGLYATKIDFFNFQFQFKSEGGQNYVGSGQFGKVYASQFGGLPIAIKLITFDKKNLFQQLKKIYMEYFIVSLASQLKIGPKLIDFFGYHIVFFKNFALFGMQLCQKIVPDDQSIQKLRSSLNILHSFHVVHRDIKPDNIMWSQTFQKHVFIDFGLSLIIREIPGQETTTMFAGSYNYCSPEMKKCFLLREPTEVDLYKNDLFGLEQTKKKIHSTIQSRNVLTQRNFQFQTCSIINSISQFTRIIHKIYKKKFMEAYQLSRNFQHLMKTTLYIVQNTLQKQQMYPEFKEKWNLLRNNLKEKIIENKFVSSQNDEIIVLNLKKTNLRIMWTSLLLSQKHLENFDKWSENQVWIERLYKILIPDFSIISKLSQNQFQDQTVAMVNKIYCALKLPATSLFMKKFRAVLLFFFNKFKQFKSKNYQIYGSIPNCFYQIRDYLNFLKVKEHALQMIEDVVQYCLTGLQFHYNFMHLFQKRVNIKFIYLNKIKDKISKLGEQIKNDMLIVQISEFVRRNQKITIDHFNQNEFIMKVKLQIEQLREKILSARPQLTGIYDLFMAQFYYLVNRQNTKIEHNLKNHQCQQKNQNIKNKQIRTPNLPKNYEIEQFKFSHLTWIRIQIQKQLANSKYRKEIVQFFYEMTEAQNFLSSNLSFPTFNTRQKIAIETMILEEEIKYLKMNQKEYFFTYFTCFKQKISNFIKKNLTNLHIKDENYFFLLNSFLKEFTNKVSKLTIQQHQKQELNLLIEIATLIKMCYPSSLSSQGDIIKSVIEIFEKLIKTGEIIQQFLSIYSIFLMTMIRIWSGKLLISSQKIDILEDKIMKFDTFLRQFLKDKIIYQSNIITKIRIKRCSVEQNLHFIFEYISFVHKNRQISGHYQVDQEQEDQLCNSISFVFQKMNKLTKPYLKMYQAKILAKQNYLKCEYLCLFLSFLMIHGEKRQRLKVFNSKFLLISSSFNKYVKNILSRIHFELIIENFRLKGRKLVIFFRVIKRTHLADVLKMRLIEFLKQMTESVQWPKKANRRMKQNIKKLMHIIPGKNN